MVVTRRVERASGAAPRPGDPPARRPGLPGAGRRAAVPARRLRDRRPPRHAAARRPRHRRARCWHAGQPVHLPGLRHHGLGRPPGRRRAAGAARSPRASPGSGWPSCIGRRRHAAVAWPLAGPRSPGSSAPRPRSPTWPSTTCGSRSSGAVPMLLMLAATGVLRGPAGHPDPAGRRGRRQPGQHRAQPGAGLRRRASPGSASRGSALGTLLAQLGSAVALVWVVVRAARRAGVAAAPARRRRRARRPRRRTPDGADPDCCGARCW